jgi:hypothetical protein
MKSTVPAIAAAVLLSATAAAVSQATFTGTWVLDPKRSEGIPPDVTMTMTVKQDGDRLQIETAIVAPQGQQTIPDVFVLDGKETDYQAPVIGQGAGKGKRTAKWNADKTGFESTEAATISGPDGEGTLSAKRKWTLAADGNTLTIDVAITTPMGSQVSKRVFTKKS